MANDLSLFSGSKVSLKNVGKQMAGALRETAQQGATGNLPDGGVYINYSGKMQRYSVGPDKENMDPNELWVLNVLSIEKGWVCWKGGAIVDRRLASVFDPPIAQPDPNLHAPFGDGEGWKAARQFRVRSIDRGIEGQFMTSSISGVSEVSKILDDVAARLEEELPAWPVFMFKSETFRAQGNTNGKPVLEEYGWLGNKQIEELAQFASPAEAADALDALIDAAEGEADGEAEEELDALTVTGDSDDEPENEPEPEPAPRRARKPRTTDDASDAESKSAIGARRRRRANV